MIIYGRNVIREALQAGVRLSRAYLLDADGASGEMRSLEEELRRKGAPIEKLSRDRLDAVAHSREHQGIAAKMADFAYAETRAALSRLDHPPFVIILDRIQDPHNLGAIIRTSYGAGADLIVLPAHDACLVTPAVLKTSAGYAFRMPIAVETNLSRTVESLKERGIWVYGAVMGGEPCFAVDFSGPVALVFGNEGEGIRKMLLDKCDFSVSIPMAREMDSLNVSVSVAVIAFRVTESRRAGGSPRPGGTSSAEPARQFNREWTRIKRE